jgi:hypothetical protein
MFLVVVALLLVATAEAGCAKERSKLRGELEA